MLPSGKLDKSSIISPSSFIQFIIILFFWDGWVLVLIECQLFPPSWFYFPLCTSSLCFKGKKKSNWLKSETNRSYQESWHTCCQAEVFTKMPQFKPVGNGLRADGLVSFRSRYWSKVKIVMDLKRRHPLSLRGLESEGSHLLSPQKRPLQGPDRTQTGSWFKCYVQHSPAKTTGSYLLEEFKLLLLCNNGSHSGTHL